MNYLLTVIVSFFLVCCYQKIDLDIKHEEYLIVDALIKANSLDSKVGLNLYSAKTGIYKPISEAEIYIEDEEGGKIGFDNKGEGFFKIRSMPNLNLQYRLVLNVDKHIYRSDYESFGKKFSETYALGLDVIKESFYTPLGTKETVDLLVINLSVDSKDDSYVIYDYEGIYKVVDPVVGLTPPDTCWYGEPSINYLKVQSSVVGNRVELMKVLPSNKFTKYNLFLKEHSISEKAFLYWSEMQKIRNIEGTIFDAPPSIVRGNIRAGSDAEAPKALGYFTLSYYDSLRLPFSAEGLVKFLDSCDPKHFRNTPNPPPPYCFSCELHPLFIAKNEPPASWKEPNILD